VALRHGGIAHAERRVSLVSIDTDIDDLARQFLASPYGRDQYANWPLDRRLEGFLDHRGMGHLADDGDIFSLVCDRVMAQISCHP
jgi:hypothetical protein